MDLHYSCYHSRIKLSSHHTYFTLARLAESRDKGNSGLSSGTQVYRQHRRSVVDLLPRNQKTRWPLYSAAATRSAAQTYDASARVPNEKTPGERRRGRAALASGASNRHCFAKSLAICPQKGRRACSSFFRPSPCLVVSLMEPHLLSPSRRFYDCLQSGEIVFEMENRGTGCRGPAALIVQVFNQNADGTGRCQSRRVSREFKCFLNFSDEFIVASACC